MAKTQMKLEEMNKTLQELAKENSYLKLQLAQKKSLDNIEKKAMEELGMVEPEEVRYVYVDSKKVAKGGEDERREKQGSFLSYLSHGLASLIRNFTVVRAGTLD